MQYKEFLEILKTLPCILCLIDYFINFNLKALTIVIL